MSFVSTNDPRVPGSANGAPPRGPGIGRRCRAVAAVAAGLIVAAGVLVASPAAGQDSDSAAGQVRITARKLDDGRIEFGLQQRATSSDAWGQRQLPRARFFPTSATVGRWLNSSPLAVNDNQIRITARKLDDGRVEFGLQQRASSSDAWGQRQLPRARFFPATATAGRWLNSSPLATTATAPPTSTAGGQYTAVSASDVYTCAITTSGAIACWGDNTFGQTDAPSGTYSAITTADRHACALGSDNTITCWGNNTYGQTDVPSGTYSAVSAAGIHTCALNGNGAITCWGNNWWGQTDAPSGTYTAIATAGNIETEDSSGHSCALATDGTIECWGDWVYWGHRPDYPNSTAFPGGTFETFATSRSHSCGLRTDGTIACWGDNTYGQTDAPSGTYTAVATGGYFAFDLWGHSCALATDGTIECWSGTRPDTDHGQADAPSGTYTAVTVSSYHSCGLRTDGTIACWGANWQGQTDVPDGS